jgi:hypothetical protein
MSAIEIAALRFRLDSSVRFNNVAWCVMLAQPAMRQHEAANGALAVASLQAALPWANGSQHDLSEDVLSAGGDDVRALRSCGFVACKS